MVNSASSSAPTPLHLGGMGVPLIDFITPTPDELSAGDALIAATTLRPNAPPEVRAAKAEGAAHIAAAKIALAEFHDFWVAKGYHGGDKKTLSLEDAERVAHWFEAMLVAARDINKIALFAQKPEQQLFIRYMGGSMANKLHAIKAGAGDAVEARMLGAVGDEDISGNRARLMDEVCEKSKLRFDEFEDVSLGHMGISYITATGGDRLVLKAPIEKLPEKIGGHLPQITDFAQHPPLDAYLIEGSDIGDGKFGEAAFTAFLGHAKASGKPVVFSLPTNTDLVCGTSEAAEHARAVMFDILNHPHTGFISCNEEEAVALFCNEKLDETRALTLRYHPQIHAALSALQATLKAREATAPEGGVEPVAFFSIGKEGAFAVTASQVLFSPAKSGAKVANTIGAGDGFFSGTFIRHEQLLRDTDALPLVGGQRRFTQAHLQSMLDVGQTLAFHVVQQKGAQLPPAQIAELVHGAPPAQGVLDAINQPHTPTRGR